MAKRYKKRSKFKTIKTILSRLLLVGAVLGRYYVYQNPQLISQNSTQPEEPTEESVSSQSLETLINQEKVAEILGKTTEFVEEGLETIKVPKQLSGSQEEIVIQDVVDDFTEKVKDLPSQQVDKIKVQFCQDILGDVEGVAITTD